MCILPDKLRDKHLTQAPSIATGVCKSAPTAKKMSPCTRLGAMSLFCLQWAEFGQEFQIFCLPVAVSQVKLQTLVAGNEWHALAICFTMSFWFT